MKKIFSSVALIAFAISSSVFAETISMPGKDLIPNEPTFVSLNNLDASKTYNITCNFYASKKGQMRFTLNGFESSPQKLQLLINSKVENYWSAPINITEWINTLEIRNFKRFNNMNSKDSNIAVVSQIKGKITNCSADSVE